MLRPSLNLCRDSGCTDMLLHLFHKALHIVIPHALALCDLMNQVIIGFRFQIL